MKETPKKTPNDKYTESAPYRTRHEPVIYTPRPAVAAPSETKDPASVNSDTEPSPTGSLKRGSVSYSPPQSRRASDSLSLPQTTRVRGASDSVSLAPREPSDPASQRRDSTSIALNPDQEFDSSLAPSRRGSVASRRGSFFGDEAELSDHEREELRRKIKNAKEKAAAEEIAAEKAEAKAQQPQLHDNGFEFVKKLNGGGVSGSIDLYKYTGSNAEIKQLLSEDGTLLIKFKSAQDAAQAKTQFEQDKINHAIKTFDLEWQNINEGLSQYNKEPNLLRPRLFALDLGGQKFILNECIYYSPSEKKDMNLASYLNQMGAEDMLFMGADRDAKIAMRKAQLDKFFLSMSKAQDQIHAHHFLHLDTATRNLCVLPDETLKMIDFGGSMPMRGMMSKEAKAPYALLPTQSFDQGGLTESISIKTDFFARRITMMDSLAQYMSLDDTPQGMYYNGLPGVENKDHPAVFLRNFDDNVRLKQMFDNLMQEAIKLEGNNDIRGTVVKQQLTKYEKYLTVMPPMPANSKSADFDATIVRRSELANFNRCMNPAAVSPSNTGLYKRPGTPPPPPPPAPVAQNSGTPRNGSGQ